MPPKEEGQTGEAKKVLLWDRKTEGGFPGSSSQCTFVGVFFRLTCRRNESIEAIGARSH